MFDFYFSNDLDVHINQQYMYDVFYHIFCGLQCPLFSFPANHQLSPPAPPIKQREALGVDVQVLPVSGWKGKWWTHGLVSVSLVSVSLVSVSLLSVSLVAFKVLTKPATPY